MSATIVDIATARVLTDQHLDLTFGSIPDTDLDKFKLLFGDLNLEIGPREPLHGRTKVAAKMVPVARRDAIQQWVERRSVGATHIAWVVLYPSNIDRLTRDAIESARREAAESLSGSAVVAKVISERVDLRSERSLVGGRGSAETVAIITGTYLVSEPEGSSE